MDLKSKVNVVRFFTKGTARSVASVERDLVFRFFVEEDHDQNNARAFVEIQKPLERARAPSECAWRMIKSNVSMCRIYSER